MTSPLLRIENLRKRRATVGHRFELVVPSFELHAGELVALVGESGCGKSTLLDLVALALAPDAADCFQFRPTGSWTLDVAAVWRGRSHGELDAARRAHVGYVLQTGGLLPFLTVRENLELPLRALGRADAGVVREISEALDLRRHLEKLPRALSVGERQRVAIGRALVHRPALVIADEPTSAVDPLLGKRIMQLFLEQISARRAALLIATHASDLARSFGLEIVRPRLSHDGDGTVSEYSR